MTADALADLRRRAYDEVGPLPTVDLRPATAVSHVLAEPVHALVDLPPQELAALGGWAVAGPGPWFLVAPVHDSTPLADGTAAAVESGTALPYGATSVVAAHTGLVADGRLHAPTLLGDHIRPRGAEVAAGTLLIPAATVVTPGAAALAAAGGNDRILVTGRPTIAVLVTYGGGADPSAPAAVEAMLPALLTSAGAIDAATRRIPDTSVAMRSTIEAVHADVVVVTGVAHDERARSLDTVLAEARADVVIDGRRDAQTIADTSAWLLARLRDGRIVVGLPGDLRSAVAEVLTLVRPLTTGLSGYAPEELGTRALDVDVIGRPDLHTFVFVRGTRPTPDHGPATGHGVAAADALVLVPSLGAAAGTPLPVLPVH